MMEFLTFRRMITPLFIQVIFWIGTAGCVISGLIAIVSGFGSSSAPQPQQTPFGPMTVPPSSGGGAGTVMFGLAVLIFGPLIWRIYCELLIVIFKIHSELVAIREGTGPSAQGFPVIPPR
jgi:hypothetical protein